MSIFVRRPLLPSAPHYRPFFTAMAIAGPPPSIVGALRCQRDSYLQTLQTEVVSCSEYSPQTNGNSKSNKSTDPKKSVQNGTKAWLIEFRDSILFPEGGGQPTDHGSITPLTLASSESIPITSVQRHGLRCVHLSPQPLDPGTLVRQDVNFKRRWDHMQQHTGQHLLSAIMDSMNLDTLSWSMGADGEMNYVEVVRRPTNDEIRTIQERCNAAIRQNLPITVETPNDAKVDSLPEDYDQEKGIVRVINIGGLDSNPCCGTHLKQTSHISLILLHHTQTARSTTCRLYFTAGDRAINLAAESINSLRSISVSLSCGNAPSDVQSNVAKLGESVAEARQKEKKLLKEIAKFEGDRIKAVLETQNRAFSHRGTDGLDFVNLIWTEVKEAAKERGVVVLASGEGKSVGHLMIIGQEDLVEQLSAKVKVVVSGIKGGGKGKWQGKVQTWKKGEIKALKQLVEGFEN
ncbi:ThrRS/AlaRS common domain-containing protein [Lindgomyces ingoldianus]|uniref:ThrRS/AlaRS common domain-containing protein n=1 Tax=Lindgomyces ingoldianus TaxID=673940 RepID=A0ACB6RB33_9PLEO|nr:ThrRS/AlaRS common domain-containing protein [Lindgomyces ingoldianus]KAF2476351.1 ThrRS/AlaRS common domain-containing protein [Lindgomyces ingoldianus]